MEYMNASQAIALITNDIVAAATIEDPYTRLMAMAGEVKKIQEEDIKVTGMLDGSDLLSPSKLSAIVRSRYPYLQDGKCKSINIYLTQAGLQTTREVGRIKHDKPNPQKRVIHIPTPEAIQQRLCSVQYGGQDLEGRITCSLVKWRVEVVDVLAKRFGW